MSRRWAGADSVPHLGRRWPLRFWWLPLCLFLGVTSGACGYRIAAHNRVPRPFHTLLIKPLQNETTSYEIEQILTRSLVREFVKRTDYSIVQEESRADAVLEGRVTRVTASPVTFARSAFASTFLVTVYAAVELKDEKTGKVLFSNNQYIFREQYIVNIDVKNFFSEMNPALDRIATDFAAAVVASIVDGF
jgi:hypothetical protein